MQQFSPGGEQPPQTAMPPGQPGANASSGPQQVPPEFAQHIDPNNQLQMLLLQRVDKLTPADGQALAMLTPPQVAAIKKVLPELAFMLDMVGGPGGTAAAPAAPQPMPSGAPTRPTTALARF